MAAVKNRFLNPANGAVYTWHINHGWDGEERSGVELPVTWSASTGGAPLPQYGEQQPQTLTLKGTILHRAQHEAFQVWATVSQSQSIYFRDFDMTEFEVVINRYQWTRVGVSSNPADPTMPLNIYRYEMLLTVLGWVA